jgi:hypothetical protein
MSPPSRPSPARGRRSASLAVQFQRLRQQRIAQFAAAPPTATAPGRHVGLVLDAGVDAAALLGDLREVAHARAGNQRPRRVGSFSEVSIAGSAPFPFGQGQLGAQQAAQIDEHPAHAGVVELAGDGGIDRDVLVLQRERVAVARHCLRTSRSASSAPRLSNLFSTTRSAKSSMSIFSSWLGAP